VEQEGWRKKEGDWNQKPDARKIEEEREGEVSLADAAEGNQSEEEKKRVAEDADAEKKPDAAEQVLPHLAPRVVIDEDLPESL